MTRCGPGPPAASGGTSHAVGPDPGGARDRAHRGATALPRHAVGAPPAPRDERDAVVILPVHGIETQRIRGNHAALAKHWRDAEGPATACLYASDARTPPSSSPTGMPATGWSSSATGWTPTSSRRLWTMLGRARRVVSNRLSTPVVYAAHLGADVAVYGDPLRPRRRARPAERPGPRAVAGAPRRAPRPRRHPSPGGRGDGRRPPPDPAAAGPAARVGRVHAPAGRRVLDGVGAQRTGSTCTEGRDDPRRRPAADAPADEELAFPQWLRGGHELPPAPVASAHHRAGYPPRAARGHRYARPTDRRIRRCGGRTACTTTPSPPRRVASAATSRIAMPMPVTGRRAPATGDHAHPAPPRPASGAATPRGVGDPAQLDHHVVATARNR